MFDKEVHVVGDEDIVLMLGLLGIEGTIIENREEFLKVFNDLINLVPDMILLCGPVGIIRELTFCKI